MFLTGFTLFNHLPCLCAPINVFVFGEFNCHHKNWLTHSCCTGRSGELKWPYSDGLSHLDPRLWFSQSALLDFFLSSGASICSTLTFPPLGNFDHVVVSVSFDFSSYSHWDALFHCISYGFMLIRMVFVIIWKMFHGRISLNFASPAASELCEWVQVGIYIYIPHWNYQVKSTHLHDFQLLVLL